MSTRGHRRAAPVPRLKRASPGQPRDHPGRLLRILAVPLAIVVILLGVVVSRDLTDYRTAQQTTTAVRQVLAVQNLVEVLSRAWPDRRLPRRRVGFQKEMLASRSAVDRELGSLDSLLGTATGAAVAGRTALANLDDSIKATREGIDTKKLDRTVAFDYFTSHIGALTAVNFGLDASSNRELTRGVAAFTALSTVKEQCPGARAAQRRLLGRRLRGRRVQPLRPDRGPQAAGAGDLRHAGHHRPEAAQGLGAGHRRRPRGDLLREPRAGRPERPVQGADQPAVVVVGVHHRVADLRDAEETVGRDISAIAGGLRTDATQRLGVLAGLVLLGVIGAAVVLLLSARAITRPLSSLVLEAGLLAEYRLPQAVARAQSAQEEAMSPPCRCPCHAVRPSRWCCWPAPGPGAVDRVPARHRAGHPAPQHRRVTGEPGSAKPEPAAPALPSSPGWSRRRATRRGWRTCSSWTTWPPVCDATPRACWCSSARRPRAGGRRRCRSRTWCGRPSPRWRSTGGSPSSGSTTGWVGGAYVAGIAH